ncbi:hypothetical protein FSP39_021979 [Pinctada imbricata]|uniref:Protein phosphatase 1 regulatory subunit 35 C-terminal domain-containing protein n=1 Tax=Pinctada imbricata TaxID=66713 RepID=A0AA88YI37_PINIB|nr:hypothetical protein FSP39_021979 [Pinctada imbricata]
MATHLVCQPTEPLAHYYQNDASPSKLGHGAVSQYELLNYGNKSHTQFPPPGWDHSQSSEDSLPLCQAPVPTWKITGNLIGPDPQLCITPEKPSNQRQDRKTGARPQPAEKPAYPSSFDPHLCVTPEKEIAAKLLSKSHLHNFSNGNDRDEKLSKQKVRFEVSNSELSSSCNLSEGEDSFMKARKSKVYQPTNYTEDENVLESKQSKSSETRFVKKQGKYISKSVLDHKEPIVVNESVSAYEPVLPTRIQQTQNVKEKVIDVSSKTKVDKKMQKKKKLEGATESKRPEKPNVMIKSKPDRKVRVTRETREKPSLEDYDFPFAENGEGEALESEHVFLRPEYNSALRMRKEIDSLKDSNVDVVTALEKKLRLSEGTTSNIREKAASKVNAGESHYGGLISLDIPVEDIRLEAEKARVKKVKYTKPKPQESKSNEPDLMEFFTPDLQKEYPELSTPGLQAPSEMLTTASPLVAFDLYRHNRVWENTSYFKKC